MNVRWTYEACREEAMKYITVRDFRTSSQIAYNVARANGWVGSFGLRINKMKSSQHHWTEKRCSEAAREFSSTREFRENKRRAYNVSRYNGWILGYIWLFSSRSEYLACVRSVPECNRGICADADLYQTAARYDSEREFSICDLKSYIMMKDRGILGDIRWLKPDEREWNYDSCRRAAEKCDTVNEFRSAYPEAYRISRSVGWLRSFRLPRVKRDIWTEEKCRETAGNFTDIDEFRKAEPQAYRTAYKCGWLPDYVWLYSEKLCRHSWKMLLEMAESYDSESEFRESDARRYDYARRLGILKNVRWKTNNAV